MWKGSISSRQSSAWRDTSSRVNESNDSLVQQARHSNRRPASGLLANLTFLSSGSTATAMRSQDAARTSARERVAAEASSRHGLTSLHHAYHGEPSLDRGNLCSSGGTHSASSGSSRRHSTASDTSSSRPSTSVFGFRTAELSEANSSNICVGLATEWLGSRNDYTATDRMSRLTPGSAGYQNASARQALYETSRRESRDEGASGAEALLAARTTALFDAGLNPSHRNAEYDFTDSRNASHLYREITSDGTSHLLSLRFDGGSRHAVATSTRGGRTRLFDPNYGEFEVSSRDVPSLFASLSNRYANPDD